MAGVSAGAAGLIWDQDRRPGRGYFRRPTVFSWEL